MSQLQPPDTYSDMSFVSCSYTFLRIYSQRALSLFRRDWTYCGGLVCTGHVAGESTHLWGEKGTNGFNGYFLQCKSYDNDDNVTLFFFFFANNQIFVPNFATLRQKCKFVHMVWYDLNSELYSFRAVNL